METDNQDAPETSTNKSSGAEQLLDKVVKLLQTLTKTLQKSVSTQEIQEGIRAAASNMLGLMEQ